MGIEPFNYQKRTNIEEHNQIVDKLNEVIDAVNNISPEPSEFEQRIDALELSAINQQNAIEGIHTRDALQDTAIQRAEDNVSALGTDVSEIGTRIDTVEGQNLQQDSAIATLGQRVGATEDNVTGLTGRVGQLETDTTNLDGRVTDIDGRLNTLAENYTALGGRVDSTDSEVGQLSTKVANLETGKVGVAQGTENNGKYLGVGADGNVTLKEIVIPEGKSYRMAYSNAFTSVGISTPNTTTIIDDTEGYLFKVTHSLPSRIRTGAVVRITLGDKTYYASRISVNGVNGTTMSDVGILYNIDFTGSSVNIAIWVPAVIVGEATLLSVYFNEYTWNLEVEA